METYWEYVYVRPTLVWGWKLQHRIWGTVNTDAAVSIFASPYGHKRGFWLLKLVSWLDFHYRRLSVPIVCNDNTPPTKYVCDPSVTLKLCSTRNNRMRSIKLDHVVLITLLFRFMGPSTVRLTASKWSCGNERHSLSENSILDIYEMKKKKIKSCPIHHFSELHFPYLAPYDSLIFEYLHLPPFFFSTALPAHSGPRPLTQFRNHFSQTLGLLGRVISPSQGLYLNTGQHKQNKRIHTPNIHALSGIRTHDPSDRASEDSSYLRPRGYCDRPFATGAHKSMDKNLLTKRR
jgi:hypothetical protein